MRSVLKSAYFERKAPDVARGLLGAYLVRRTSRKTMRYLITETEAYDGFKDRASHALRGKTVRTEVMFGPPGRWYVYFVYGMHHMLNIVCGKEGYPSAVLIRGVEGISGPGRLTKTLRIGRSFNKKEANEVAGLWIERGVSYAPKNIKRTPRVGISYAGEKWANKKWRFIRTTLHK